MSRRTILILIWALCLGLPTLGVVVLRRIPPPSEHGCTGPIAGAVIDHLARCDHGARLTVSSNDGGGGHAAIFLIDGRIGTDAEKWTNEDHDKKPMVTITLPAPTTVGRAVIHHAGVRENETYNTIEYILQARVDGHFVKLEHVNGNRESVRTHTFKPVTTDAVRVEIVRAAQSGTRARIYEMEVHAQ